MKGKINKKLVVIFAVVLMLSTALISTGFAADNFITVKGFFSSAIKVFNDNQQVSLGQDSAGNEIKPFVMNNTTYLPIRALSNVLGKQISWDGGNNRIDITDSNQQDVNYLLQQMVQKQEEVKKLEAKVVELEAKIKKQEESPKNTISDLQKTLNNRYDEKNKVQFDISLSGTEKNIKVRITESKNGYYGFSSLSSSEVKTYIGDIVDDIRYEFKDADVEGYIENYSGKEVSEFYRRKSGSLVIDTKSTSGSNYYLSDMEDTLNRNYGSYNGRYGYASFRIALSGNEDRITVNVTVDEYDWTNKLDSYDRDDYVKKIIDEIERDFRYANISGTVKDSYYGTTLKSFYN